MDTYGHLLLFLESNVGSVGNIVKIYNGIFKRNSLFYWGGVAFLVLVFKIF